jgi:hypothetical protein
MEPSIYDKLAARQMSETTISEFNKITKDTFIDKKNVEFWSGVITVARAMEESRTYSHGLPIPESGTMGTVTVADGASESIKPTGTEVWQVQTISSDSCTAFLTDGSGIMPVTLGGDNATVTGPLYLTAKIWIGFQNGSGSSQTPGIAYHKVGL